MSATAGAGAWAPAPRCWAAACGPFIANPAAMVTAAALIAAANRLDVIMAVSQKPLELRGASRHERQEATRVIDQNAVNRLVLDARGLQLRRKYRDRFRVARQVKRSGTGHVRRE